MNLIGFDICDIGRKLADLMFTYDLINYYNIDF